MKIDLADITMHYTDCGEGFPILLIHGFPLNRQIWTDQVDYLSKRFRVIAPDLRGHGETFPTPGPYTMDMLADDCLALLDSIGIKEPVVVGGLSMGGYVTLAFYRRYPQRVAALILAATRASADSAEAKANRDASVTIANAYGPSAVITNMLPKLLSLKTYDRSPQIVERVKEIMEQTSLNGMVGALQGMRDRPDSNPLLKLIDVPVLIMHGNADQVIKLEDSQKMYNQLPNATLVKIPDCGHLLNLEQPQLFNTAVCQFIDSLK